MLKTSHPRYNLGKNSTCNTMFAIRENLATNNSGRHDHDGSRKSQCQNQFPLESNVVGKNTTGSAGFESLFTTSSVSESRLRTTTTEVSTVKGSLTVSRLKNSRNKIVTEDSQTLLSVPNADLCHVNDPLSSWNIPDIKKTEEFLSTGNLTRGRPLPPSVNNVSTGSPSAATNILQNTSPTSNCVDANAVVQNDNNIINSNNVNNLTGGLQHTGTISAIEGDSQVHQEQIKVKGAFTNDKDNKFKEGGVSVKFCAAQEQGRKGGRGSRSVSPTTLAESPSRDTEVIEIPCSENLLLPSTPVISNLKHCITSSIEDSQVIPNSEVSDLTGLNQGVIRGSENLHNRFTTNPLRQSNEIYNSIGIVLSRNNMGYKSVTNNTSDHRNNSTPYAWGDAGGLSDKMEEATQRTAAASFKSHRDDDDTTIESHSQQHQGESSQSPVESPLRGQHIIQDNTRRDESQRNNQDGLMGANLTSARTGSSAVAVASTSVAETHSTCSVSTAPSTADEASLGVDSAYYSDSRLKQDSAFGERNHRRVPSWEVSPHQQAFSISQAQQQISNHNPSNMTTDHGFPPLPPAFSPMHAQHQHHHGPPGWASQAVNVQHHPHHQSQMSNFRGEQQVYPPHSSGRQQQQLHPSQWSQQRYGETQLPFLPPPSPSRPSGDGRNTYHRQGVSGNVNPGNFPSFQMMQQQQQQQQQQRKSPSAYNQANGPSSSTTPPRGNASNREAGRAVTQSTPRNTVNSPTKGGNMSINSPHRPQPGITGSANNPQVQGSQGGSRSSSEVLKTLLRKKACLYEPDTSRAVALVTWLVGRELALEFGFFSRQQLQAGVHACVASKIDSGVITRTKVNRCMQIILNSCFHYIIPRPDGSEENGESFRDVFADEMTDDSFLLRMLPHPWGDISVNREEILNAFANEENSLSGGKSSAKRSPGGTETPVQSPRLGPIGSDAGSPVREQGDDGDGKRAVLLCFNENVRKAEDVFRCHNEFIRDTAHASNLQLSSNEWRLFFGREAANAPHLWGNIGIPVPFMEGQGPAQTDALGVLNKEEIATFRTSWCSKRYDHSHELCGFAHAEVNNGWLRRDPSVHQYRDELCPAITSVDKRIGSKVNFLINECPHGVDCEYAHSVEEIIYHPRRYKHKVCASSGRPGGCSLGDVCPNFHPADSYRFPKKSDARSPRHSRQSQPGSGKAGALLQSAPHGTPIIYASPSPMSSFEHQLLMPGLQSLFRRQCSVIRARVRNGNKCKCYYNVFGDDAGIKAEKGQQPQFDPTKTVGLLQNLQK